MKSLELVRFKFDGRLFLFSLLLLPLSSGQPVADNNEGAKVIYDQRQSGKYNIRINIKDVTILEMDSNNLGDDPSSEEDYYYDEDDLTVKPLKLTTPSHLTRSSLFMQVIPTSTQSSAESVDIEQSSTSDPTSHRNPTKSVTMVNSDVQTTQSASMHTTKQVNTSYRETEQLASPHPYSNKVPVPESKSPISMKLNRNIQERLTTPSISLALAASSNPEQKGSQNNHESRGAIEKQLPLQPGKSNYLTKYHARRCRENRFLDGAGNCRTVDAASFLKRIISAIATLPFAPAKEANFE